MAKKRREQEPGARLTKCSLTVAVTQQSWRDGNHYLGLFGAAALPAPASLAVGKSGAAHRSQSGNRLTGRSPTRESPRTDVTLPDRIQQRPARYRESQLHDSHDICSARSSITAIAHSEVTTSNIHRVRNGSRHFCAAGTFCASFRHAMTLPATCAPRADSSFLQG